MYGIIKVKGAEGMNYQQSFTDLEYANRKKKTKREEFLEAMDYLIPWDEWVVLIEPYYPSGKRGRPTRGIETMLRMYFLAVMFNLSDEGVEDAIYDSYAFRKFMRIDFFNEQTPDATTLCKFRKLMVDNGLQKVFFESITRFMNENHLILKGGSIVDATIINAPSSTKNEAKQRDPEMHSTKKGNQWYHGMKIHSGTDAGSGYVHTITATSANAHDIDETTKLIREDDEVVYGDSGYSGIEKREEVKSDEHLSSVRYVTNRRPSSIRVNDKYKGTNWDKHIENRKSSTRCKVEHPFLIVKKQFGYCKVAYRGLAKNLNRFHMLFASANLVMCARAGRTDDFLKGNYALL